MVLPHDRIEGPHEFRPVGRARRARRRHDHTEQQTARPSRIQAGPGTGEAFDSHADFATGQHGFAFPLLGDEAKEVGRAYGVLGPVGFYRRCVFVVDGAGLVTYVHRGFAGATFRRSEELLAAIRSAV